MKDKMQGFRLFRSVIVLKAQSESARKELRFINQTRKRHFGKPSYGFGHIFVSYEFVIFSYFLLPFWFSPFPSKAEAPVSCAKSSEVLRPTKCVRPKSVYFGSMLTGSRFQLCCLMLTGWSWISFNLDHMIYVYLYIYISLSLSLVYFQLSTMIRMMSPSWQLHLWNGFLEDHPMNRNWCREGGQMNSTYISLPSDALNG